MFGMGTWEIALILVIALLILGPDKLPGVARSIGKALREMRRATNDLRVHMELDDIPDEARVQTAPPEHNDPEHNDPEHNDKVEAATPSPKIGDKHEPVAVNNVPPSEPQRDVVND